MSIRQVDWKRDSEEEEEKEMVEGTRAIQGQEQQNERVNGIQHT